MGTCMDTHSHARLHKVAACLLVRWQVAIARTVCDNVANRMANISQQPGRLLLHLTLDIPRQHWSSADGAYGNLQQRKLLHRIGRMDFCCPLNSSVKGLRAKVFEDALRIKSSSFVTPLRVASYYAPRFDAHRLETSTNSSDCTHLCRLPGIESPLLDSLTTALWKMRPLVLSS